MNLQPQVPPILFNPFGWLSISLIGLVLFVLMAALGCSNEGSEHSHSHNVYPHRPGDFRAAVLRLNEIHQTVNGIEALPAAKQFQQVEDHVNDSVDHPQSAETTTIKVDIFQELADIIRWLPTIAAESDLPKEEWDQINEYCKSLGLLVQELKCDLVSIDSRNPAFLEKTRLLYRERGEEFAGVLERLNSKLEVYDAWEKKFLN